MRKKIFVVGTGRSGTHWLGYILKSSNELKVDIEKWPIFPLVTQAAVNYKKRYFYLPLIILYYNLKSFFSQKILVDKSHPNLWIANYLIKYVPNSFLVGILRSPHATVSSMLRHQGVMNWIYNWKKYPVPNEFLGITNDNYQFYDNLSLEEKCTMRWVAHKIKMQQIANIYPDRFFMIDYEMLFDNHEVILNQLSIFLNLKEKFESPKINYESRFKWRDNLNKKQVDNINSILKRYKFEEFIECL
ncbi:sulfotransferase [Algoriphagus namhaensis]|uniref:Sulfotransferase n=1 Tax=Algoriphagus namhaensis TaxID=915353 RepID=A0ABV8ASJ3_9BACT